MNDRRIPTSLNRSDFSDTHIRLQHCLFISLFFVLFLLITGFFLVNGLPGIPFLLDASRRYWVLDSQSLQIFLSRLAPLFFSFSFPFLCHFKRTFNLSLYTSVSVYKICISLHGWFVLCTMVGPIGHIGMDIYMYIYIINSLALELYVNCIKFRFGHVNSPSIKRRLWSNNSTQSHKLNMTSQTRACIV